MRYFAVVLSAAILAGCGKKDAPPAADSSQAMMPAPPAPLALANLAGNWDVDLMGATSDSILLTYRLTATADTAGWTMSFPNRPDAIPMRVVAVAGDSAIIEAGPYSSALRSGMQVRTVTVMRLEGDQMVSHTAAHYAIGGIDSVVQLRSRGRRAQ